MRVVVALGGNALSPAGGTGSAAEMRAALGAACGPLAELVVRGAGLVLVHGNGPQVGRILLQQEAAAATVPPMPMDVCGAETQGQVGYLLAEALEGELLVRGLRRTVVTLVTRVLVDPADPAFRRPTKPVGPTWDAGTARALAGRSGWTVAEVAPGRWRRVVPSPRPLGFLEAESVRLLAASGHVLVAAGGGGVPVVPDGTGHRGVDAVVDKDRAAAELATLVGAEQLVVLTEVPRVQLGWGRPGARELRKLSVSEARALLADGEFAEGSMGPKVEACCDFLAGGGQRAVIAALDAALGAVFGDDGTVLVPG